MALSTLMALYDNRRHPIVSLMKFIFQFFLFFLSKRLKSLCLWISTFAYIPGLLLLTETWATWSKSYGIQLCKQYKKYIVAWSRLIATQAQKSKFIHNNNKGFYCKKLQDICWTCCNFSIDTYTWLYIMRSLNFYLYSHLRQNFLIIQTTKWSARRTHNQAIPGSSPALATCWICSWSSQVQILGHTCK